jgi:quercetin dioxygenase-like cupin family protein
MRMEFWQLDAHAVQPHAPQVLHSQAGAVRVILLQLPAGERLQEHQVHEHALVQVLNGELVATAGGREERLTPGGLLHFSPGEAREVAAVSDARLLITLAPWPGAGHPSLRVA